MIAAARAVKMFFVGIDLTKFARDDGLDFLQARTTTDGGIPLLERRKV